MSTATSTSAPAAPTNTNAPQAPARSQITPMRTGALKVPQRAATENRAISVVFPLVKRTIRLCAPTQTMLEVSPVMSCNRTTAPKNGKTG